VRKVLIADDSPTTRMLVSWVLARDHYQVFEASNGQDSLALLAKEEISLLLCDVNMPDMDGFQLIARLRQELGQVSLPILMLTAEQRDDLIDRARDVGAQGWVVKPFKAELLLAAVHQLIQAKAS
jgi:two-component system chemotaxis response regulator CheY